MVIRFHFSCFSIETWIEEPFPYTHVYGIGNKGSTVARWLRCLTQIGNKQGQTEKAVSVTFLFKLVSAF
jgi:hypothetical protein